MKFSVWPSYSREWSEVVSLAQWAERTGWHAMWFADHLMPHTPDDSVDNAPALEAWTVLAAIGALVPRIELTSMVSPVTIHHPVVLAKRAATVAELSGGRAVLGLGAGWQVNEHRAYGFDLDDPGPRVDRFAEAIQVIHHLLNTDAPSFAGHYYNLRDAPFSPRPTRLPLLVGTGSPRMMRLTARWADRWNTWGNPTECQQRTAAFTRACTAVDRDPSSVYRCSQALVYLVDDHEDADRLRQTAPADRSLIGGVNELADLLGMYVQAGVDEFAVPDFTLGDTPQERHETYDRILTEVIAQL